MGIKLILVCKDGPAKEAYAREAKSIGIEIDTVSTFGDLCKAMISTPYQGIMLDVITSIKAPGKERESCQDILDIFPLIQLKWDGETKSIHTVSKSSTINDSLANFVNKPFKPRTIRFTVRKMIHFNSLLASETDVREDNSEHTVTINVSQGGCFLFSGHDWSAASDVYFIIKELRDKTPITGKIRWNALGKKYDCPGNRGKLSTNPNSSTGGADRKISYLKEPAFRMING